jgi:DNA-binding response OmpR family regulator
MVVDDDEDVLIILKAALNHLGYRNMDVFSDPLMALQHFEQASTKGAGSYELVISDVKMPTIDGLELAAELLRIEQQLSIIMMSACS